ncbi:oxidoreductase [Allgaiera indica]|uniref:Glycine/D-amino acid oxidase n=1 Tax=Allgaiera indica TaxID=765699 RepID=A0AAN4UNB4_9RHOB|nr:oxidoreductase [Allgaiera indica]SDW48885.1 Glycine/D-amino acid oxidase [Allgaiera indica]
MAQVTAVDVTVRGGGIFGLSVAWVCARRGARVRLIERRAIGAGSSGGIVGALAPHVPENWNDKKAFQLESLLMAEGFWAEIETVSGLSTGYARLGRLQSLSDERAAGIAHERRAGAARLWQGRAGWDVVEASAFPDWAPASPTGLLIHDTLSARLHPRLASLALAAACRAQGVEIVIGDAPDAGAVVWATGYEGLAELSRTLGKTVGAGVKGQAVLLGFDASDMPQLYADGLHIVPHGNGTVAIGSTSEREFEAPDRTDAQCDALLARARAACPALDTAPVLERWAGVRPRAKSRAPMLGPWPGRPGHFIANGGFKIGFGMAPKAAEAMADLIVENRDTLPDGFRVEASL